MATFEVVGAPLPGPEGELTRLSFSPDGRYIAAVTDQPFSGAGLVPAVALVWDVAKGGGPIVQYPFSAANRERDVVFHPDSKRILVAGSDSTAIVDIASGREVGRIDGASAPIAISPGRKDARRGSGGDQGVTIGLFDLTSGQQSAPLAGHRERLVRLAFGPDGTTLASGGDDRLVMVWDVASGQRRAVYTGHAGRVNALAFSPDGTTLWSGGDDRAIFVWDLQRVDTLVHRPPGVAGGPTLPFVAVDMVVDRRGRYVVFPSADDLRFRIRDVATGALGRPSAEELHLVLAGRRAVSDRR